MADFQTFNDLYVDEQMGSEHDQAYISMIENRLKDVHTSLPGIIKSYNPDTNTVSVQPSIQRVFVENGPTNLPLVEDVPVVWPGGDGWSVTFPVAAGDECVLIFSERCIDFWHVAGSIKPPAVYRMHHLSDAFAFVGVRNLTRKLNNVQTDGMELRNEDRSIFLKLTSTGIQIKGNVSITGSVAATGDVTVPSSVPSVNISLSSHEHVAGTPQSSKPVPPL